MEIFQANWTTFGHPAQIQISLFSLKISETNLDFRVSKNNIAFSATSRQRLRLPYKVPDCSTDVRASGVTQR